jgi:hypothetical protein
MKSQKSSWSIPSNKMIAVALFATAILLPVTKASSQPPEQGQNHTFQGETVCKVNGMNHSTDALGRIWAVNAFGHPYVIGHIIDGPHGLVAIRNDGAPFSAACK